jgi:hypothetical protein
MVLIGAAALVSTAVNAQFKFSKVNVADGVKTPVKSGDKVNMNLNAVGNVEQNFVVDIDIAAFLKTYKYDVVTVAYERDNRITYQYDHEFASMLNTKKYAGKGIVPVYAYDTKKFKETDFRVLAKDNIPYEGPTPVIRKVSVYGKYITGEEWYFDENEKYQERNKYSEGELLGTIEIVTVYNKAQIDEYNAKQGKIDYDNAVSAIENLQYKFKQDVLPNINQHVAPVVLTPIYMALADGFREVWDWKVKTVQDQMSADNVEKSVAAVEALRADLSIMLAVSMKDKNLLKTMNKEIKTKTTSQEKWDYILSNK